MLPELPRQGPRPAGLLVATALALLLCGAPGAARPAGLSYEYLFTLAGRPAEERPGRLARVLFGDTQPGAALVAPAGVVVDPAGRVWITDRATASLHRFDLDQHRRKLVRGAGKNALQCPAGVASDSRGNIYVADACAGRLLVFDPEGEFLRSLPPRRSAWILVAPAAVAVSDDLKSIYVTDPPRRKVVVLNQEGETIRQWGSPSGAGALDSPAALALDHDRIFVLDTVRRRVQIFSPGGAHLGTLVWPQVREPSALAFDRERRLFLVGDPDFEAVHVLREDGSSAGAFGQSGSGPGQLRAPAALAVDALHRIYVVDPANGQVLVFGPAGELSP